MEEHLLDIKKGFTNGWKTRVKKGFKGVELLERRMTNDGRL
jgi:hypothetical protein